MASQGTANPLRGWINDMKGAMKVARRGKPDASAVAKSTSAAIQSSAGQAAAGAMADFQKLKAQTNLETRIDLCEAYLTKWAANKQACAAVEDLLAQTRKAWGVAEAKKAYEMQVKGESDPRYNPAVDVNDPAKGNKYDFQHTINKGRAINDPTGRMSAGEATAVHGYTDDDFRFINPAVTNQRPEYDAKGKRKPDRMDQQMRPDPSKALSDDQQQAWQKKADAYDNGGKQSLAQEGVVHAAMLMEALKKLPNLSGRVYRGSRATPEEFAAKYKIGSVVTLEAFKSQSRDEKVAREFASGKECKDSAATVSIVEVAEVVTAKDVQSLSSLGAAEKEWLLSPGMKLKVIKIENDSDRRTGTPPATAWKVIRLRQVIE